MGLRSWYEARVMPRLVTCACSQGQILKRRAEIVPLAHGDIFELGCGGGINQQFYDPARIASYSGIDPHEGLLESASTAARHKGWSADLRRASGESIPFADRSFDTIVCTFTMCSVATPERVLSEFRRILRPGGKILFLEHGCAPDHGVARWQKRIEPVWKPLAGGCHLTRPVGATMRAGGFDVEPIGQGYTPRAPKFAGWMEWGIAHKPGL